MMRPRPAVQLPKVDPCATALMLNLRVPQSQRIPESQIAMLPSVLPPNRRRPHRHFPDANGVMEGHPARGHHQIPTRSCGLADSLTNSRRLGTGPMSDKDAWMGICISLAFEALGLAGARLPLVHLRPRFRVAPTACALQQRDFNIVHKRLWPWTRTLTCGRLRSADEFSPGRRLPTAQTLKATTRARLPPPTSGVPALT